MQSDFDFFRDHFESSPPPDVVQLYSEFADPATLPVGFRFPHVNWILEIQYMLSARDPRNYDVPRRRLAFAVTTDGADLLIDLGSEEHEILQREGNDVDSLGLTLRQLLDAERYSPGGRRSGPAPRSGS